MLSAESKKLTTFTRAKGFRIKFQNPKTDAHFTISVKFLL